MNNIAFALCCITLLAAEKATIPSSGGIGETLQPFVDNRTLAGAVTLVASKDKLLDVETVGFADLKAKKPMRADSLFWIASMSKPMTATALMMLVDEGKVNVDDSVEKYLPEFKGQWLAVEQDKDHILLKHPRHPITVKNILSHTSGLLPKSAMEQPTLDLLRLRDAVHSYAMTPLQFEPDTKWVYANAGINTAGRIVEVVSGMPYEAFMEKRLFLPLGMKDTTFWPDEKQLKRLAKSYQMNAAKTGLEETPVTQLVYPLNDHARQPMPAGGLFSTAADVARFCQMFLNDGVFESKRYLSEASVRQMTSSQIGDVRGAAADGYGFGFAVKRGPAGDGRSAGSFGHGGAYKTLMWIDPQKQLILVLMRQHNGPENKVEPAFLKAAIQKYSR